MRPGRIAALALTVLSVVPPALTSATTVRTTDLVTSIGYMIGAPSASRVPSKPPEPPAAATSTGRGTPA